MNPTHVGERLGDARVLGHELVSELDSIDVFERGLPHETVDVAIEGGMLPGGKRGSGDPAAHADASAPEAPAPVASGVGPPGPDRSRKRPRRGGLRRCREGARARRWLPTSSRALRGAVPLELLKGSAGTDLVQEELTRIEHEIHIGMEVLHR